MLTSIRRGFGFLQQAAEMAAKDRDLLKPSLYALVIGIFVSLCGAVPMVVVGILFGTKDLGSVLLFILGAVVMFVEFTVSYLFSGMTVRLVYDYLTAGDGRMDQAWAAVKRNFLGIVTLALASVFVKLLEGLLRGNRRGRPNAFGGLLAGILNAVWTTATYFVLPAMILEDLNLAQALKRATQIIKNNLLLVAVSEIGVSAIIGLIGFGLVLLTIALGVGLVVLIGQVMQWTTVAIILGIGLAVLLGGTVIAVVTVLSSYVTTAYHTCLFLWAREVEKARQSGQADSSVQVPVPVAAVL